MTAKSLLKKLQQESYDVKGLKIIVTNDTTGERFYVDGSTLDAKAKELELHIQPRLDNGK